MLISTDWIKDFVKIPDMDPVALGEKFTLGTAEVEGVEEVGSFFEKIRVAEIKKVEPHPDADKLRLVTFNFGESEDKKVVCGASNVRVGLKTPYAPLGVTLPNGLTLEPKKIRGVLSEGMLCSEEELGYAEESSGIMELKEDAPVGKTIKEYFDESVDTIIDVDNKSLTHRPDLWGHLGLAREFAAVFETKLNDPYNESWAKKLEGEFNSEKSPITPKVDSDSSCLAYWGLSLDNVSVTESPKWMQRRLKAVGLRPINNIVDISNYVMLELGIPLHIFDRETIDSELVIERVGKEDTFVTLDEIERKLIPSDTVIRDAKKPLVLAGIMGGLNSGVTEKTTKIFIEVANWKAAEVRKTSTRLGLRTDSSQRYEKTLDSKQCYRTLLRTLELVKELCRQAKVIGKPEYDGSNLDEIKELSIDTSVEKINKVLGHPVSKEKVISIFSALDFKVVDSGETLNVTVPTYRSTKDIECEADLIEEVGRIVGYDNIEPVSPPLDIKPVKLNHVQKLHRSIRNFLSTNGEAFEIMSYPLVGESLLKKANYNTGEELKLINALSKDHDRMRLNLIPSLLEVLSRNSKNMDSAKFFEIGRVYRPDSKNFSEDCNQVAIVHYQKSGNPFMGLVNSVERMLNFTSIPADLALRHPKFKNNVVNEEWSGLHPHEFYNIRIMGKMNGVIFSVHPKMLRNFKIKGQASIAIIDLSSFESRPLKDKTKYTPLPKFPESNFDYTLEVDKNTQVEDILSCLKKVKIKELVSNRVVDVYTQDSEKKSVTLRSTFFDAEKTLSGEFLKESESKIIQTLEQNGFSLKQG